MRTDTKARIIKEGARRVHEKGFNATGLQEILAAAGVPKGSFYFYFRNKEDFGLQVIDDYARRYLSRVDRYLEDRSKTPVRRLRSFFDDLAASFEKNDFKGGCPLGNLSLEMGDLNEKFRIKLEEVFKRIKLKMAACLEEARTEGEVPADLDVRETSDFLWSSFQGALLQMKVSKTAFHQKVFDRILFEKLLKG